MSIDRINIGDIVLSTTGRDKGNYFLVVDEKENFLFIVDGKKRKVKASKKKNKKHLKSVVVAGLYDLAIRIKNGEAVGNEKVFKAINRTTKIEED